MKNADVVLKFLTFLGLDFTEAQIYFDLVDKGGLTVLEISKESKLPRTTIYRIVDRLKGIGVIEEVLKFNKKVLYPVGTHKLEMLVKEQEDKVKFLKETLPQIQSLITYNTSISQPGTKVLMYKGVEGIKQMVWNTLKAKSEIVGYSFRSLSEIVGEDFAKKWEEEILIRRIKFRDIISDSYIESVKNVGMVISSFPNTYIQTKYLSKDIVDISYQSDIYDEVLSFYSWHENEVWGVEIYNEKIAKFQKQIFEVLWKEAKNFG